MLLEDEQYVIKWLSQYGALPKSQIVGLLQKDARTADKILWNLKRETRITNICDDAYIALDSMCKPDQKIITAVWILLKFIENVEPMAHYPAGYPAQVYFLKENTGYEIIVLCEGDESLLGLLQPSEDLKYIIVLPHISMADNLRLPKASCLLATVDFKGQNEPKISFYSKEARR